MAEQQWSRNNFRVTPNAEPVPIQIVGSSTFGRYHKIASGLTYNMFISDDWLVNFAGYKRVVELIGDNIGEGRGLFHSTRGNILIVVIGAVVFQLDAALNVTQIGILSTGVGEVFMDENLNNQICIVDGVYAYIYNYATPSGVVAQNIGTIQPSYVCFHNTYFLIGNQSRNNNGALWYAYGFNTTASPPPDQVIILITSFAISTKPDYAIAVRRLPGQANNVIVFGTTVCEIWTQVGGIQNYRRNQSVNIDYGCLSVSTIGSCEQYTAWLAVNEDNSPIILIYSSQGLKRISSDGIDHLLDGLSAPQDSTALFYTQDGHLFYQLTFFNPADNLTLVYDLNTEKFFNLSDQGGDHHPARKMVYFNQTPYFISLNNASLYSSDTSITVYNENLSSAVSEWLPGLIYDIPRTRICETIRKPDSGRFIVNSFVFTIAQGYDPAITTLSLTPVTPANDIITEGGVDIIDENGDQLVTQNSATLQPVDPYTAPSSLVYQPRVDMAISKDAGTTWSSYVGKGLNPIGQRKNIITWNNLGAANELTLKFRFWGTGAVVCSNGFVELY
jgi:hypothetical protein